MFPYTWNKTGVHFMITVKTCRPPVLWDPTVLHKPLWRQSLLKYILLSGDALSDKLPEGGDLSRQFDTKRGGSLKTGFVVCNVMHDNDD